MSFKKCIEDKVKEGLLTKTQADQAVQDFEKGLETKDAKSAYESLKGIKKEAHETYVKNFKRHNDIKTKIKDELSNFKTEKQKLDHVRKYIHISNSQGQVEFNNIQKIFNDDLKGGLRAQPKEDVMDALASILDGKEGKTPIAKKIKSNIQMALRYAKNEADQVGLVMGDLGDTYLPRSWNREKISKVSTDDFVNGLLDKVKWKGRTEVQMREFLTQAKIEIQTNGRLSQAELRAQKLEANAIGETLGEVEFKRNVSREIHFKDSDSHFNAMDEFGFGRESAAKDLEKYFFAMGNDLALARTMGPRSRSMVKELQAGIDLDVEKVRSTDPDYKKAFGTDSKRKLLNAEYNVLAGTSFSGDRDSAVYRIFTGSQLWMRAAHLGSAVVSALSDMNFNGMTNKLNGGSFTKPFADYFKVLSGFGKKELKQYAEDMGYFTELFGGTLFDEARFSIVGDAQGGGALGGMRKISDFTFNASGLNQWTKAGKLIAQVNANHTLSDFISNKTTWDKLPTILKDRMINAGLNETKWGKVLSELEVNQSRKKFFNADDLRAKDPTVENGLYEIAEDLDRFVFQVQDLVVNENNLTTRAITSGSALFGSAEGVVGSGGKMTAEAIFQYKNFPITVMLNHLFPAIKNMGRGLKDIKANGVNGDNLQMAGHLGMLVVGTGLMAQLPIQIKEVIKGREFKKFDTDLFIAGLAQGGGAGILGDFMFQDQSRFGGSIAATLAGPYVSTAEDVYNTFIGNRKSNLVGGKYKKTFAEDLTNLARRNTPVVSSLWYTRLIVERMLFDNIEKAINSDFDKKVRRKKRSLAKNNDGQGYWWGAGERPDPSKIFK